MRRLLDLLLQYRNFFLFIGLELLSFWLLFSYNQRYNTYFFNSSNGVAANLSNTTNNVSDFFELEDVNIQLMRENFLLKQELENLKRSLAEKAITDTTVLPNYKVIGAKVVGNMTNKQQNFITISAGAKEGIKPGMGAITASGIVGQVKSVSKNFSTLYSVLNTKMMVAATLKNYGTNCTVQWDKYNAIEASLKYIPRHISLNVGDTIVTSGYNSSFPANSMIGTVSYVNLEDHLAFYEARIKLSTDFTSLKQVFVIVDELKQERDSLELNE